LSDSVTELDAVVDLPAATAAAAATAATAAVNLDYSKETHSNDSPIQQQHNKQYGNRSSTTPTPPSPLDRKEAQSEGNVVFTTTPNDNDDGTKQTTEESVVEVDPFFPTQHPRKINITPKRRMGNDVQIRINGRYVPELDMIFTTKQSNNNFVSSSSVTNSFSTLFGIGGNNNTTNNNNSNDEMTTCRFVNGNELRPPTETLNVLLPILTYGRNHIRYTLISSSTGINLVTAEAHIYLWKSIDSVIVSDVDGTITKSDIRGVIDNFQERYEHVHDGICKFYHALMDAGNRNKTDYDCGIEVQNDIHHHHHHYHELNKNDTTNSLRNKGGGGGEVRFLYLTSRPIRIVNQTRKLLVSLSQPCPSKTQKNYGLPPGPIMCHRSTLTAVLYGELIAKNMYLFKSQVLSQQVVMPFVTARGDVNLSKIRRSRDVTSSDELWNSIIEDGDVPTDSYGNDRTYSGISADSSTWDDRLFVAGFGNKLSDAIAYEMAGMDRRDIYIIDKDSRIRCMSGSSTKEACDDNNSSSMIMRQESDGSTGRWIPILAESFQAGGGTVEFSPEIGLDRKQSTCEEQSLPVVSGAKPIHSIEVTDRNVAEEGQFVSRETSDDLITSTRSRSTTVDVYVTSSNNVSANTRWAKVRRSVRPFSTTFKKSLIERLPSYGSFSSIDGMKSPSKNYVYVGYDDPRLFDYIRERLSPVDGS
jgi:phosphatidate phosphatase LPIN